MTLGVVAVAFSIQGLGLTAPLDRRIGDALLRWVPLDSPTPSNQLPDVTVVTIDPRSLRAFDDWPWPRSRHARAVDLLEESGARAIAFDIDFSSPSTVEENERLSESLRRSGRVALATFSQFEMLESGAELEVVNRPISILEEAAAGLGSVLVPIDPDGAVRRVPRDSPIAGEHIPSLARTALAIAAPDSLRSRIREAHVASDSTWVDYRRTYPEIPTLPYVDLLEGNFDPATVENRVVFIGATAAEFQDLWSTPVAPNLPGVMIQAIAYRTAAAEALGAPILAPLGPGPLLAAYLLLGALLFPRSGGNRWVRLTTPVVVSIGVVAVAWWSLWQWGVAVPVSAGLGIIAAQYALGIEDLQSRIEARALIQESSLRALARLGEASSARNVQDQNPGSPSHGLALALELLGEVVRADGIILLRSDTPGRLSEERMEWRPSVASKSPLDLDLETAEQSLSQQRTIEKTDPERSRAPIVFTPLIAGEEAMGVLVLFGQEGQVLDGLARRTITTVAAQMALTAQNLQLIERLRETFESSIAAVAGAVEARDGYTDQHCRRLAAFSSLMGSRVGMTDDAIRAMALGALLHDVGKIGIPDAILNKPGRLSHEERDVMERHPAIGAGIVAPVVGLEPTTLDCVIHHHERWDGSGYPDGLAGEEIPLAARIVSIVDVWDALSTQRPYKKAFSQPEVFDILSKGRGTQFDPELVDVFFEVLEEQGEEMLELVARSSRTGEIA